MNINHMHQRSLGQDALDQSNDFMDAAYLNPP